MNKIDEKTKLACANLEKDKKKPIKEKAKRKKKIIIILTLALNFGILLFLKYFNFFGGNLNSLLSIMNLNLSIPHLYNKQTNKQPWNILRASLAR